MASSMHHCSDFCSFVNQKNLTDLNMYCTCTYVQVIDFNWMCSVYYLFQYRTIKKTSYFFLLIEIYLSIL
jgi:hypothetical protein